MFDSVDSVIVSDSVVAAIARAIGFSAMVPGVGSSTASIPARVLVAALLAAVLVSASYSETSTEPAGLSILSVLAQLTAGLLLGFTLRALHLAVQAAARLVEQQLGFAGNSEEIEEQTALSRLYQLTALVVFLDLSGHRAVVSALLNVSRAAPDAETLTQFSSHLTTAAFGMAIHTAMPLIMALLSMHVMAGMVSRLMPQFAGSSLTAPAQVMGGLILLALSTAAMASSFGHGIGWALNAMNPLEPGR